MVKTGYLAVKVTDWCFCQEDGLIFQNGQRLYQKRSLQAVEARDKREKHVYYCYAKDLIMKNNGRVNVLVSYDNPELEGDPVFRWY